MKLVRHSIYNLLGLGLPLIVAVFCIPILIRELGEARFGLLTLIWAVVSYFGLFDLGLGRALTQQVAVAMAENDEKHVGALVATASALMAGLGIFAGLLMALSAPWGVGLIQSVPDQQEAVNAVLLMALAMPAIVLTSGFRGVLEALHAFGTINSIRLPMGLFTFLGPVVVVLYGSTRLDVVAGVLAAGRIVACAVHAWYAWRVLPDNHGRLALRKTLLRPLCVSGGWLTLSNIISPFMGYVDRFLIAGIVSAAAAAYYTTPQEMILRLWILPGALTAVLFPTFSAQFSGDNRKLKPLFNKAVTWLFLIVFPITLFVAIFSFEILEVWIGEGFARESATLMQIFSIGVLINCLAHIPYTLIQSANAPRTTALIHCVQFPLFVALVWWMTIEFGVLGAALAWLIRMIADSTLMFGACWRLLRWPFRSLVSRRVIIYCVLAIAANMVILVEEADVRLYLFLIIFIFTLTLACREFFVERGSFN
ncbi:membrane protein involved in the export of O-antigen and teichoic acid [Pseudomonas sp. GM21]|uniref:flippase n=1 Tax=Pseudomonas sp. GM21 TaxID=1144325 RepID=UPI0002723B78|nr:flippase [Pseudomonas sp. GM21]EJM23604.1 membrane protein involved in the export of O-antigen and teichoic acid [Pseudomonas sp. GM21]